MIVTTFIPQNAMLISFIFKPEILQGTSVLIAVECWLLSLGLKFKSWVKAVILTPPRQSNDSWIFHVK